MNSHADPNPVKTRFQWVILVGVFGGSILSIPFWEIFDPKQALPYRRYITLAIGASYTGLPFIVGLVAGRDCGGSNRQRIFAGSIAGALAAFTAVGMLYCIPSWITPIHPGWFLMLLGCWVLFSAAGGEVSKHFNRSRH